MGNKLSGGEIRLVQCEHDSIGVSIAEQLTSIIKANINLVSTAEGLSHL